MKRLLYIVFITLFGCTIVEDITPPCIGGCDASAYIFYPKDNNGYYHINNNYFPIYFEATNIISEYRYNGVAVIEGKTDYDKTRVYFKEYDTRDEFEPKKGYLWSKKIIINAFPDTLIITPTILWEAGSKTVKIELNEIKIILE